MSLTQSNATVLVRSLIKEATAKFWTDAEIALYLTAAMQEIWGKYSPWLYVIKKSWADLGTVANVATASLPTGCYKMSKILAKENGRKLRYIHDDEMYKYAYYPAGTVVAWTYKAGQINFVPTPSSTDTDYCTAYFLPNFTDITSFPDTLQMLVCVVAAIYAKTKDEDVTADLIDLRKWHEDVAVLDMEIATEGQVEAFPDFFEEDTLA